MKNKYVEGMKKEVASKEGAYFMTGLEAAKYVADHESKFVNNSKLGVPHDARHDAVSQFKAKLLGCPIESGVVLEFENDQMSEARTEAEWFGFFLGQIRARAGVIYRQNNYWRDRDLDVNEAIEAEPDEDYSPAEAAFLEGVSDVGTETGGTEFAEDTETVESEEALESREIPSAILNWKRDRKRKVERIRGAIEHEKRRLESLGRVDHDRETLRQEIRDEVRRIAVDAGFSERDITCFMLAVFAECSAKEVLDCLPAMKSPENVDRVKSVVKKAITKAALRPGSRLAYLHAA